MGIFALLDEESRWPLSTDQSLSMKLHNSLSMVYPEVFVKSKNLGTSFHIIHYAGKVKIIYFYLFLMHIEVI